MNILVIFAHPNPASFNHAVLETVVKTFTAKGHAVAVRDLYGIRFDPILAPSDFEALAKGSVRLDVAEEQRHIQQADLLVFIHPVWWFAAPAILKGWIDRVLTLGFAFQHDEQGVTGLLAGKKAALFCTAAAPEAAMAGVRPAMDLLFAGAILKTCGLEPILQRFFFGVDGATNEERAAMLQQARADAESIAPKA